MPTIPIAKKKSQRYLFWKDPIMAEENYSFSISISSVTDTDTDQKTSVM